MSELRIFAPISTLFLLAAFAGATAFAQTPRTIDWADLRPEVADEPLASNSFDRLTPAQTDALRNIVRARAMDRMGLAIPDEGREYVDRAQRQLVAEGVDVDGLLAERDRFMQRRKEAAEAAVTTLGGGAIRLSGYALPVTGDAEGVHEFLLVPWVGACSHAATPPANQIVRVLPGKPAKIEGSYSPVTIEGRLRVGAESRALYFVDGPVEVRSVYAVEGAVVASTVAGAADLRQAPR